MTGIAAYRRLLELMALNTPFHSYGLLELYDFLLRHFTMAALTLDLGAGMLAMAKGYKVRYFVEAPRWNRSLLHGYVAYSALRNGREARNVTPLGIRMAQGAALL
jgi:hypothetical protein